MRLFLLLLLFLSPFSFASVVTKYKVCKVEGQSTHFNNGQTSGLTETQCIAWGNSRIINDYIYSYSDKVSDWFWKWDDESFSVKSQGRYRVFFRQWAKKIGTTNYVQSSATQEHVTLFMQEPYQEEETPEPCKTPKTDDQCNKGKTATITGNDVFWATGNYKGCTFTAADGVFIKLADGSMTGDATSTGSTGKSWCETTDSSYNPADDEALSKNPAFSPAKDNDPKNCKNGWVQAGGGKFHCLNDTSGNVDAPPDKVNPDDGSINSDKDGKPKPPDAGVGKPPTGGTDPDGGGGTGPDGGGGDCEGEDCEGGGGGTKPPARPADPWVDILDAADVARVKADTQSVQDELADFYRTAASGFQINISKPSGGSMPSFGDLSIGGDKVSLSVDWLDKISFVDARAGVLILCALWAAYIILVRR